VSGLLSLPVFRRTLPRAEAFTGANARHLAAMLETGVRAT
jgi:hypothetical protein